MTEPEFVAEYFAREKRANRKPEGADHKTILACLARQNGIEYAQARAWVLDATLTGGAG